MNYSHEQCGRFSLPWDMNADGLVTITDLFKWADFFFHIPVKFAVEIMANTSSLATFFEIDCLTGEGFGGVFFSVFLWYVFLI